MKFKSFLIPCLLGALLLAQCQLLGLDSDEDDDTTALAAAAVFLSSQSCSSSFLNTSKFRHILSATTISCTLSNGSTTTCCQMTFTSNQVTDNGPFCPTTVGGAGGYGMYNGASALGGAGVNTLYYMGDGTATTSNLWRTMETDGYDVTSTANGESGTVNVLDPATGNPTGATKYCLQATANDNLTITYTIPLTPQDLSSVDTIATVENIGISLDGVPITGDPPTVTSTQNNGSIPALDNCGGHHDPTGYYHWHFIPESVNITLAAKGFTASTCSNITQDAAALTGFAKDGYPIYAQQDMDGTVPTDLDACNGHTAVTADYPGGVYHYHASATSTATPNQPGCVKGASVTGMNPSVQ